MGEKLQNYTTKQSNVDNSQLNKRRNLNHINKKPSTEHESKSSDPTEPTDSKSNTKETSNANDFAQSLNVLEQILNITAGHAKVEHPLCSDCTDKIMKGLDGQIEELNLEKKTLKAFIAQWDNEQKKKNTVNRSNIDPVRQRSQNNYDIDEETRFKQYQEEATLLEKKLSSLSVEKERLKLEFEQLEIESQRMNEFEEMFFCDANDFWYSIENLSMQHAAVRQKIRQVSSHLEMMKRTNVFDDAFHIIMMDILAL